MANRCVIFSFLAITCITLSLSACFGTHQDGAPRFDRNVSHIPNPTPKPLKRSRSGNPKSYTVMGKTYHILPSDRYYNKRGIASWYGTKFHGRLTSSGERYNMWAMTAANKVLPIPCYAQVTNLDNHRQIIVKINDRGPFAPNRIIDLSYTAAKKLGMIGKGTALVNVATINPATGKPYIKPQTHYARKPKLYLQVAALSNKNDVRRLEQRLKSITHKSTRSVQHKNWYRVQVGPLKGVGDSDKTKALLDKNGYKNSFTVIQA